MTAEVKAGDSAKKDAPAEPKKSLGSKLGGIAFTVVILIIFMYFLATAAPEVVNGASSLLRNLGKALSSFGSSGQEAATGVRDSAIGIREVIIELLNVIITVALFGWAISLLIKAVSKKKDGAGDAGHH